jgi:hypothetical protein
VDRILDVPTTVVVNDYRDIGEITDTVGLLVGFANEQTVQTRSP